MFNLNLLHSRDTTWYRICIGAAENIKICWSLLKNKIFLNFNTILCLLMPHSFTLSVFVSYKFVLIEIYIFFVSQRDKISPISREIFRLFREISQTNLIFKHRHCVWFLNLPSSTVRLWYSLKRILKKFLKISVKKRLWQFKSSF